MNLKHITCLLIIILIFCFSGCTQKTFQGKLIDADTLKPIEGAVVVAVWDKGRPSPAGTLGYFKDAKETLTDKDGEWAITGPAGYQGEPGLFKLLLGLTIGVISKPSIICYKPGYRKISSFIASPYINKDQNLEGIILIRRGETNEEFEAYRKKYDLVTDTPFIPVKDPEKKLRNLDFSFKYPDNVRKIYLEYNSRDSNYFVIGLKKAVTREERLRAMRFTAPGKLPLTHKMQWEERERLYGKSRSR